MAFKGNIESFSLADVFQNLAMNTQTGTLRITPERNPHAEEKYVYFQDGAVRFLSGTSRAPLLPPEVFLARGFVSKSEFDAALIRQAETHEPIVACLIGMGYANEQQVQELLVHQIEEEIYDLFGWEAATFEFNEGPPPEGLFAAEAAETGWGISIPVSHLIMEAARRVDEWERLRKVIPSQKEIFVVDLTVRKAIERGEMETDPVERRVAMLVDGARDVEDIVEDSKLFKFEVIGALAGFLGSSVIRPATLNELNFSEGECSRLDLPKRRVKILERILALGGENLRIRRELADLMAKMGQTEHACIHYSILAIAELKDNNEEGAIEIYKRILAIAPSNVKIRGALAALLSKRGQKRDAFMQYQELFENLRDQHLLREARDAAAHALENDPSNAKMRNALVELLLMEDNHDEAGNQLEQLGDYAARARNTGLAAESYRRAMQYRKNIRPLKKKLNEVLLTKEDRAARRHRMTLSLVLIGLIALAFGGIYYWEMLNQNKWDSVKESVEQKRKLAGVLEDRSDFLEAKARVGEGMQALSDVRRVWSPIRRINQHADDLYESLKRDEERLTTKIETSKRNAEKKREEKHDDVKMDLDNRNYLSAKQRLDDLLKDPNESDENKRKNQIALNKVNELIARYDAGLEKIRKMKDNPAAVFKDAGEQMRTIQAFIRDFASAKMPKPFPIRLSVPLLVTPSPELGEVQVDMDGERLAPIRGDSPWQERLVYYPIFPVPGSHTFTFTKHGYTSQVESTAAHSTDAYVEARIHLDRKPALTANFPYQFDGEASYFNGLLYAGTSEGSLLEIDVKTDPPAVNARFDVEQPLGGVERRVFGKIFVSRESGKPPTFFYCTKAGYCAAVVKNGSKFELAWNRPASRQLDPGQTGLDFPPTFFDHNGKTKAALLTPTRVILIDADSGSATSLMLEMPHPAGGAPVVPTAGACYIDREGGMLAIPGSDSNIHVMNLTSTPGKPKKADVWQTNLQVAASVIKVAPVAVTDVLVVTGNDGSLRFFNFVGRREPAERILAGGTSAPPLVSGLRLYYACSGAPGKEGISMLDLSPGNDRVPKSNPDFPLVHSPTLLGNRVYCVGAAPNMLYAVDALDIMHIYWKYKVDRKIACSAIAGETRIYVLTADGGLIGFDEPR